MDPDEFRSDTMQNLGDTTNRAAVATLHN